MRGAMYAGVVAYALAMVSALVSMSAGPAGYIAAALLYASVSVACAAFAAGLWRFMSVPASTGAARPARQSFVCFASAVALWFLFPVFVPLLMGLALAFGTDGPKMLGDILLPLILALLPSAVLGGASLRLLLRAMGAALQALGAKPPSWESKAVTAYIAFKMLVILLVILLAIPRAIPLGVPSLPGWALLAVMVLTTVAECAIVLALAPVVGRTAAALARQEIAET